MYTVELREASPVSTAVVRDSVPASQLSTFVPAACGEVWMFVKANAVPNPGRHVALYTNVNSVVEVGVEVAAPFTGNDRIHSSQLPSGRAARALHLGPYGQLARAHAAVREWCVANGHQFTGVSWEVYGHWQEAWNTSPDKIETEVFYLLG